jgi:hypothetical protein
MGGIQHAAYRIDAMTLEWELEVTERTNLVGVSN